MDLSPTQAVELINETVSVRMVVQRTKLCTSSKCFLDSEANHRAPTNLGIVITEQARAKFSEAGIDDPTAHFKGKSIRVQGIVIRKEGRAYIEVSEPSQIEIV
jgi:hypothetical protein